MSDEIEKADSTEMVTTENRFSVVPPVVVVSSGPANAANEQTLDVAVSDVHRLKVGVVSSYYELGLRIADIKRHKLWALRTKDDGRGGRVAKWKTFEAFCLHELGFTPQNAHALADVAENFSSAEIEQFGTAKLTLVLQADEKERARIKKLVEDGATRKVVDTEVRDANAKSNAAPTRGKNSKTTKATITAAENRRAAKEKVAKAKEAVEDSPEPMITVAKILKSDTVKLHKLPTTKDFHPEKLPRARRIADKPYGVVDLSNSVEEHFWVDEDAKGNLVLKIKRVRVE